MKICQHCHQNNDDSYQFCIYCGQSLPTPTPQGPSLSQQFGQMAKKAGQGVRSAVKSAAASMSISNASVQSAAGTATDFAFNQLWYAPWIKGYLRYDGELIILNLSNTFLNIIPAGTNRIVIPRRMVSAIKITKKILWPSLLTAAINIALGVALIRTGLLAILRFILIILGIIGIVLSNQTVVIFEVMGYQTIVPVDVLARKKFNDFFDILQDELRQRP